MPPTESPTDRPTDQPVPPTTSLYDVLHRRRDVRGEFTGEPIPDEVLRRVLTAAHSAPSVGLSQPWDYVLVRDEATRRSFREHVLAEREHRDGPEGRQLVAVGLRGRERLGRVAEHERAAPFGRDLERALGRDGARERCVDSVAHGPSSYAGPTA